LTRACPSGACFHAGYFACVGTVYYSAFFSLYRNSRIDWAARTRAKPAALAERLATRATGTADAALVFGGRTCSREFAGRHDRFGASGIECLARGMLAICLVCFLSFVSAAQIFAYQSDGMLLEPDSFFVLAPADPAGMGQRK